MGSVQAVPIREFMKYKPHDLLKNLKNNYHVLYEDDKVLAMKFSEIIITRYCLEIMRDISNIPIISKYSISNYYTNNIFTASTINKCFEAMLEDIVNLVIIPNSKTSDEIYKKIDNIYRYMYQSVNNIYNEVVYDSIEYATSINIINLLDVQMNPELIESIKNVEKEGTYESISEAYDILDRVIRFDPRLANNTLGRAYISGQVKAGQVKQVLGPRGHGTEIDSSIFKYPIPTSFTLGMRNMYDVAVESRSGAKALHLSGTAIQTSEYFSRELQFVTMFIEHMVHGDCGSKEYLSWYVRPASEVASGKSDLANMVGKRYLNEDTGNEEYITKNHTFLEGKIIKLRSPMHCKHKDPHTVCSACFGNLAYGIHKHSNLGHLTGTTLTAAVSQSILSTKHLTGTATSNDIELDPIAAKFFTIKDNDGYALKPNLTTKNKNKLYLVVTQEEAFGLKDLLLNNDVSSIYKLDTTRISRIETILLITEDEQGHRIWEQVNIRNANKYGSFTYEFLEYIFRSKYTLDAQNRYIIDISNWKGMQAIIKLPQVEFSFLALSEQIKSMLKSMKFIKGIKNAKTPESLLQELFNIVNSKLNINLALLEVIVYAFMIKSIENRDFTIGRTNGGGDAELMDMHGVISGRSMSAVYAWERVVKIMLDPRSFDKKTAVNHPLDVYVMPQEVIHDYYGKR